MKKTSFLPLFGLGLITLILSAFTVKTIWQRDPEVTFQDFLQQFPEQKLPYALDEKSLQSRLDQYVAQLNNPSKDYYKVQPRHLDWHYYKFLPQLEMESQFSRLPMMAEPVARFSTDKQYAVLYAAARSFRRGYAAFHLAVFDKSGEIISSNKVGEVLPETILSSTISKNLQAELKTWRVEWKKSYQEYGLDGNRITSLSLMSSDKINLLTPVKPDREGSPLAPPPPPAKVEEEKVEGAKTK